MVLGFAIPPWRLVDQPLEAPRQHLAHHAEIVTGREVGGRVAGSVAAALLAAQNGAGIIRVHDVAETKDALAVLAAVQGARRQNQAMSPKPSVRWPDED